MHLICPSCETTFFVAPEQLGSAGRRVKCGSCGHNWHQEPPAAAEAVEQVAVDTAPPVDSPESDFGSTAPSTAESLVEAAPADVHGLEEPEPEEPIPEGLIDHLERDSRRRLRAPPPRSKERQSSLFAEWLLLLVVVAGLAGGFYFGRKHIVAAVPGAVRLYDLVGVPVHALGEGLELREVKSVRRLVSGERLVFIEGLVANISDRTQKVPLLRASLIDADGVELEQWTFSVAQQTLPPGGITKFETSTRNPPRVGNLSIDFVARN